MTKTNGFTEEWFRQRNYVPDGTGGWKPAPIKSDYIKAVKGELITKEKVIETPDFIVKPVTEWFIPYQTPSKKNCQQLFVTKTKLGKYVPSTTTSQRYKDYITATKMYWMTFGKEFRKSVLILGLNDPLHVEFTFVRSTQQVMDYTGPLESVQDIMQDYNWIDNDDYKHLKPFLGNIEVDKNIPGVRIKLITNGK